MAIDFPGPAGLTVGQKFTAAGITYTWNGTAWTMPVGIVPGGPIYISDTAPASATPGQLWWQSSTGMLFIYYNDGTSSQWVFCASQPPQPSAPILRNYHAGFQSSWTTTTWTAGPGVAADSTNIDYISLPAAMTKALTAWTAGNGGGGIDTGATAASTSYHMHAIKRPDTGQVDCCFSLSPAAPTLGANIPSAYTLSRRMFSNILNASSQWLPIVQLGDDFRLVTQVQNYNAGSLSATAQLLNVTVPTGIQVDADFEAYISAAATHYIIWTSPDQADVLPAVTAFDGVSTASLSGVFYGRIRTNTAGQIRARADSATANYYQTTRGWIDTKGRYA